MLTCHSMEYLSTRGLAPSIPAKKAIIQGMAEDGGLYVPSFFPRLGPDPSGHLPNGSYAEEAARILHAFLTDYSADEVVSACHQAYGLNFDTPEIAPVKTLEDGLAVLELWHGPTLAFKDMALQIMPHLLSQALRSEAEAYEVVILVATSGDTGKAALEGFSDVPGTRIFVFYPHEGVSEMQRLQMVTQRGKNVGACAVRGNFDDAQNGVKKIFSDPAVNQKLARHGFRLSSANSINWGRLVPQIAYYFSAYASLCKAGQIKRGAPVILCVPTGNFGNILAAYYAKRCGLPIQKLICASNRNKVLTDFIRTGTYDRRREFYKTESPSMDILISSNLERLLFELCGRKAEVVRSWMHQLSCQGSYTLPAEGLSALQSLFYGDFAGPEETLRAIREAFSRYRYLLDPHSAVGYHVAQQYRRQTGDRTPMLLASTASPFKFNRAVLEALERLPAGKDEFALLDELAQVAGRPVPVKLAELKSLPEVHTGVCNREEMALVIERFLGTH